MGIWFETHTKTGHSTEIPKEKRKKFATSAKLVNFTIFDEQWHSLSDKEGDSSHQHTPHMCLSKSNFHVPESLDARAARHALYDCCVNAGAGATCDVFGPLVRCSNCLVGIWECVHRDVSVSGKGELRAWNSKDIIPTHPNTWRTEHQIDPNLEDNFTLSFYMKFFLHQRMGIMFHDTYFK